MQQFEREKEIFEGPKYRLGHHPNVNKYINSWLLTEDDSLKDKYYCVQIYEYCDGGDLQGYLKKN